VSAGDPARAAACALGAGLARAEPVAGGSINRALRLELDDGRRVFVKSSRDAPPGAYRAEADGLAWLTEADALRVPAVLAVGEDADPPFLALEWIERERRGGRGGRADRGEAFGRGLAALHAAGAPVFGAPRDGFIGPLPLPNEPCPDWPTFYAARRLEPLARRAVADGLLPSEVLGDLERLRARLPGLAGPPEPPARLHGDLWSGNALLDAAGGPAVIDPAAHGGHREVDLAMMRLFGGFPPQAFAAYEELTPLAPGHEERVGLWQLHPLLVHVCLFGGGYVGQFLSTLRRYV
jgi:fructosamine-3-kinase